MRKFELNKLPVEPDITYINVTLVLKVKAFKSPYSVLSLSLPLARMFGCLTVSLLFPPLRVPVLRDSV